MKKNNFLKFTFAVGLLFSLSARAEADKWAKLSLKADTIFKEIYSNSIAENIFFALQKQAFLPPIQNITRTVEGDLEDDTKRVSKEALASLGVDMQKRSTIRLTHKPFKGGESQKLNGLVSEWQSRDGKETMMTCIVVVQEDKKLHVAYVQAYQASLPTCSKKLVELARSEVFTK